MRILFVLNYYHPYISGVTETVRLLAEGLAKDKNNQVTVLCSNHDKLKAEEVINGVRVVRAPIIMKISKGTVSPSFIRKAIKMSKENDVINMQAPMLESGIISRHIDPRKLLITYHCDINLRPSFLNKFIVKVMDHSHRVALKHAHKVIVTSIDYAKESRVAKDYLDKMIEIPPLFNETTPLKMKEISHSIGFCGRIVEEKGIDVLLKAFRIVKREIPDAKLLIAGDYQNIAGGSVYPELRDYIDKNGIEDVEFLGKVLPKDLSKFYSPLSVFTLPSINSLEAFGLVQLEAMFCGIPVVASDLPGVRTIVKNTKMGLITKRKDEKDLAKQLIKVLKNRQKYVRDPEMILKLYSNESSKDKFEQLYRSIINDKKDIQ